MSAVPLPPWYQDLVHKKARLMTSDTMNRSTIMVMSTKLGATPTSKGGRWGLMLVKGGTMVAANAHDRAWKSIAYFCITHTHTTIDCIFLHRTHAHKHHQSMTGAGKGMRRLHGEVQMCAKPKTLLHSAILANVYTFSVTNKTGFPYKGYNM